MDGLLRKAKELEEKKTNQSELERKRSPLGPLPVPEQQQSSACDRSSHRNERCGMEPDLLYYLKSILGYSIRLDGSTVVLRSAYAFCNEDVFEVEIRDKKLIFRNTDYLQEWREEFNTYVVVGKSYCAFFAAVTLNLFNRKTFG